VRSINELISSKTTLLLIIYFQLVTNLTMGVQLNFRCAVFVQFLAIVICLTTVSGIKSNSLHLL